jgi:Ca2+-binding EF-hand superfamily protein
VTRGAPTAPAPATPAPSQPAPPPPQPVVVAPAPLPIPQNLFLEQYDRNRDGVLSLAELPKRLARRFEECDRNKNGLLEPDEILFAKNRIGRAARKVENLKLDGPETLIAKGPELKDDQVRQAALTALRRLDLNQDGFIELGEVRQAFQLVGPMLQNGLNGVVAADAEAPEALPDTPTPSIGGNGGHAPATPTPTTPNATTANPIPANPPTADSRKGKKKTGDALDDLPPPAEIVTALDKNQNGLVDRDEAVDRLADNFNALDKDKNGGLDAAEIERGFRLARMFGIKPKFNYTSKKPVEETSPPAPTGGEL